MVTTDFPMIRALDSWRQPMESPLTRFFDSVFEDVHPLWSISAAMQMPPVNLWEEGDNVMLECELPGVKPDQVDIEVSGDQLRLSVRRDEPGVEEKNGGRWLRRERSFGQFTRTLKLPYELDAEKVEAKLHNGILTLTMPKAPHHRPHRVKLLK
jgi:HSP20 family protein